jgi:hypothetical protein
MLDSSNFWSERRQLFARRGKPRPGSARRLMVLLQETLIAGNRPDAREIEILRAMPMHKLTHKEIDFNEVERALGSD